MQASEKLTSRANGGDDQSEVQWRALLRSRSSFFEDNDVGHVGQLACYF